MWNSSMESIQKSKIMESIHKFKAEKAREKTLSDQFDHYKDIFKTAEVIRLDGTSYAVVKVAKTKSNKGCLHERHIARHALKM
ncbi:hypothetical protein TSUD_137460 [Trifolium subterraneum]|uniref:Uncharacterized protein n=1 Tax=Trifolium subterraneum TaxID=3900 RepID=A0A2Z6P3Y3_TRISU|nr:hypothetical protein TSUD_137460 [Trifolium subterraneum]